MRLRTYLRALLGLALLLGGGIGLGLFFFGDTARTEPAIAEPVAVADPELVRMVAIGDVGKDTAVQRQVRDAIGRVCQVRGCDLLALLGDNLYPRGMEAPDDPRMDEIMGQTYASLDLPTYLVLGNHDYGHRLDRQRAAWQVQWAQRTPGFELPAPTWTTHAGPVGLWGLDTTELFWSGAAPQQVWLDRTVRASSARWRVALGHHPYKSNGRHGNAGAYEGLPGVPYADGAGLAAFYQDHVCGRFDLVLTGHDHNLQWIEACGGTFVVSGAGASTTPIEDRGTASVFASDRPGFVWISFTDDALQIAFYDETAQLLFEAERTRSGEITHVRTAPPREPRP